MIFAFLESPVQLSIVLLIALLIFGYKLPSVARSLGSSIGEFRKGVKQGEIELQQMDPPRSDTIAPTKKDP